MPERDGSIVEYRGDDPLVGRADVQGPVHLFFDTLFAGATVLDLGSGLGHSRWRIRHNRVTTQDVDPALQSRVDILGDPPSIMRWDVVTAFDVLEHVEDDLAFLRAMDHFSIRAVFLSTPNWSFRRKIGNRHRREYTGEELGRLASRVWPSREKQLFAMFKDAEGAWFDLVPHDLWDAHRGEKHCLLILKGREDRLRVDRFFSGRWGAVVPVRERWVSPRGTNDPPPSEVEITG